MATDPGGGGRMVLEWVTCPSCSTTFRVAVPSQYLTIDVEEELEEEEEAYQPVNCVDEDCEAHFYLVFDT